VAEPRPLPTLKFSVPPPKPKPNAVSREIRYSAPTISEIIRSVVVFDPVVASPSTRSAPPKVCDQTVQYGVNGFGRLPRPGSCASAGRVGVERRDVRVAVGRRVGVAEAADEERIEEAVCRQSSRSVSGGARLAVSLRQRSARQQRESGLRRAAGGEGGIHPVGTASATAV